jgi:Ca-activated chloride channel homolog
MRRPLPLCLATVISAGSLAIPEQPVFRSRVEVVEVDASVMRGSRPVIGLTANDFVVTDNGVRQEVRSATLSDLPLRITLVLDVSGSVSGQRLTSLVKAGQALADALKPADQASLITFSHEVRLRVPMGAPKSNLQAALSQLSGLGGTSLRDAVQLAIASNSAEHTRSLLLLFSDGLDTSSWLPEESVLASARQSSTVIHAIAFGLDHAFVDRLAETTGGRTWSARSDRQMEKLFTQALEEMRARYLLTYSPPAVQKPGWHAIKVSLKSVQADVTARPGYVVP